MALAGFGGIGQRVHGPVLAAMGGVDVVAVADQSLEGRQAAAARFPGAAVVSDCFALLERPDVDAIVDVLAVAARVPFAVAALESGVPSYLEKPLGWTVDDADRVRTAWVGSGTPCQVGLNFRFGQLDGPRWRSMADAVGAAPSFAVTLQASLALADDPATAMRQLAFDLGIHAFDLLVRTVGPEVVVVASVPAVDRDGRVTQLTVVLADRLGTTHVVRLSPGRHVVDVTSIVGGLGSVSLDRLGHAPVVATRRRTWRSDAAARAGAFARAGGLGTSRAWGRTFDPSYGRALRAFVEAVRAGRPCEPGPSDAWAAAVLAEAATRHAGDHLRDHGATGG